MKKIYFSASDNGGCGWHRAFLPAKYSNGDEFETIYHHGFKVGDPRFNDVDAIVIQRHVHPGFLDWIPVAKAAGKKIIYDLDDNFWCIPLGNPARKAYPKSVIQTIEQIIKLCDYVTVSTEPLRKEIAKLNPNTHILPNFVEIPKPIVPRKDKHLRIGWCGSESHRKDFSSRICSALKHVQKKFDAELVFMGYFPSELQRDERTIFVPPVIPDLYLDMMAQLQFDIGVIPTAPCLFNQCKSNIKYLEYSICGTVAVASDSYPYEQSIHQGTDGYIVKNDKWLQILELLCEDASVREYVATNAKKKVLECGTWETGKDVWSKFYRSVL